ncbi:caffeoylshikimate esterase [Olea europaea subsp. europaea]|uniref:Caffeoylshikimate esterase n=1 Tax=Olea europaea subsp. europaea TaxID=158383 RepID=A0A8S0U285_OLEEU|nr:caffeoylshikimate esterase [Olea europaea subsp. europaea]
MVHGYGNDISWTFQAIPIFLAQNGFACFALDLQGHGLSQGLKAYVPNVDLVVDDCISFFNCILTQDPILQNLPRFLYKKKIIAAMNPMRYLGKPRLGTVLELLRVTDYVSRKLTDVRLPFIALHGNADVITDPDVSRELYELSKAEDKTIKIYDGMLHT